MKTSTFLLLLDRDVVVSERYDLDLKGDPRELLLEINILLADQFSIGRASERAPRSSLHLDRVSGQFGDLGQNLRVQSEPTSCGSVAEETYFSAKRRLAYEPFL